MRSAKGIGLILGLSICICATWAQAHQENLLRWERAAGGATSFGAPAVKGDTIFYTGFEPGDPLGVNVDYNAKASPDMWHVTRRMMYQSTSPWWVTAPQDSYFCHIGDDSLGYGDGDEVGYQIQFDLTNYSDAEMYYLSAMQAYEHPTNPEIFDRFVVWGQYTGMGENWLNLDPGESYAWGGDWYALWGTMWWPPDEDVISLADLSGHGGVVIEFWFVSDSEQPEGFGVAIDEIIVTGTPATGVHSQDEASSVPETYRLDTPYPNPFNAQTSIRYHLAEDAGFQLSIFNVRGQLIKTLAQGFAADGDHLAAWDGRDERGQDVQSGIYFCQLRSGEMSLTRKLVLLR